MPTMYAPDFAAEGVAKIVLKQKLLPIFRVAPGGNESGDRQVADCYGNRHGMLLFRCLPTKHGDCKSAEEAGGDVSDFYSAGGLMRHWGELLPRVLRGNFMISRLSVPRRPLLRCSPPAAGRSPSMPSIRVIRSISKDKLVERSNA